MTKVISGLLLGLTVASAATATNSVDVIGTDQVFFNITSDGTFSGVFQVTPNQANTLKLSFSTPLSGTYSNVSYGFYTDQAASSRVSAGPISDYKVLTAVTSGTGASSFGQLANLALFDDSKRASINLANTAYYVKLTGTFADATDHTGQFKVTVTNGTVAAVPEPESYAMLLAGLGIMGGIARRRMQK